MTSDFETVLLSWKEECGGKVPIKDSSRISAYLDLIKSLEFNGFSKEEITSKPNTDKIIRESCNPNSKGGKVWIERCKSNWATAVVKVWPATLAKFDHETDLADKAKKLEAVAKSEQEAKKASENAKHSEEEYAEPSDELMFSKPIDRSLYEKLPQAEVIYDDEMRRKFGFIE